MKNSRSILVTIATLVLVAGVAALVWWIWSMVSTPIQFENDKDGTIRFYSYTTHVITITPDGWLTCTGTYSPTTRKQIGRFLREYAPALTYHHAKAAYMLDVAINIYTCETK